jgi:hypothetical protein
MRIKNVRSGYRRLVPIKQNYTMAPMGSITTISFTDVDSMVDGKEASVLRLLIRVNAGFDVTFPHNATNTGSFLDAVSWASIVTQLTLAAAANSPFAKFNSMGQTIINALDGYRFSVMQGFYTGESFVSFATGDIWEPQLTVGNNADVLTGVDVGNFQFHIEQGFGDHSAPPQFLGPFGEFKDLTNAATFTDVPVYKISFCRDADGEHPEDQGFPLRELVGEPLGDCGAGGAGFLQIQFGTSAAGSTIDGFGIIPHAGVTATLDVFADCWVHGSNIYPCPNTAVYTITTSQSNTIRLIPGPMAYVAFLKALDSGGNMLTHSYQQVRLLDDGQDVNWTTIADQIQLFFPANVQRRIWRPTALENNITGVRNATRLSRNGVPMVMCDSTIFDMPGNDNGLQVQVQVSGEATAPQLATVSLVTTSAERRMLAAQWGNLNATGNPGKGRPAGAQTKTRNGHKLPNALSQALPARIVANAPSTSPNKPA